MRKRVDCTRCGNTVRDEIVPERCGTCGAPVPPPLLSHLPRNWHLKLGIFLAITVIMPLFFS